MLESDSYIQKPEVDPLFLLWCAGVTPMYGILNNKSAKKSSFPVVLDIISVQIYIQLNKRHEVIF